MNYTNVDSLPFFFSKWISSLFFPSWIYSPPSPGQNIYPCSDLGKWAVERRTCSTSIDCPGPDYCLNGKCYFGRQIGKRSVDDVESDMHEKRALRRTCSANSDSANPYLPSACHNGKCYCGDEVKNHGVITVPPVKANKSMIELV